MIDGLDVDGGDVVGEQDDFVGVDLVFVFVRKLFRADEATLQEAGDEGAGARERIDDVDAFAAKGLAEFLLEQIIDAVDDEIDDFHGGVNDAEALGHFREGIAEEFIVKLDDDFLFGGDVVDLGGAEFHAGVEFLQSVRFFFEAVLLEDFQHVLHGLGNGIVAGEAVVLE